MGLGAVLSGLGAKASKGLTGVLREQLKTPSERTAKAKEEMSKLPQMGQQTAEQRYEFDKLSKERRDAESYRKKGRERLKDISGYSSQTAGLRPKPSLPESSKFEDIGGGLAGMVGGLGSMSGGPFGTAIAAVSGFAEKVFAAIGKLRDWNETLHKANKDFAEFSASMAGVMARQEIREIHLSRERGERRAASAEYLAEGKSRLDTAVAPWEDKWAEIKGYIQGFISDQLGALVEKTTDIFERLGIISENEGGKHSPIDMLNEIADRQLRELEEHGRPARHRN